MSQFPTPIDPSHPSLKQILKSKTKRKCRSKSKSKPRDDDNENTQSDTDEYQQTTSPSVPTTESSPDSENSSNHNHNHNKSNRDDSETESMINNDTTYSNRKRKMSDSKYEDVPPHKKMKLSHEHKKIAMNAQKIEDEDIDEFNFTEHEFETDDSQWSDLDIIPSNEQLFASSSLDYPSSDHTDTKYEECWECTNCNTMNNVTLTTRQYNYKCCGCTDVFYIPSQTETSYQCKWDTRNDYLLRENKIWICNQCKYANDNMTSEICTMCRASRSIETAKDDYVQCKTCKQYIDALSFRMHSTHCTKDEIFWICPKCNAKELNAYSKCSICGCTKPTAHNYLKVKLNQDLVYGFCRKYFTKDIATAIKDMFLDYFSLQTFTEDFETWKKHKLTANESMTCHYNAGFEVKLRGDIFFKYPAKNVWKFKLNVDEKYVVRMDGDTSAAKVYDIAIGVSSERPFFDKKSGKIKFEKKEHMITGDGQKHPMFKNNDVIIVKLDCEKRTLSFGINEDWFGAAFDLNEQTKSGYQLYIRMGQHGVSINSVH